MKTGIFGCSADPFTPAHKAIVDAVLDQNIVDRVIISPTVVDYHRSGKTPWLSDSQKLAVIDAFWKDGMPENIILNDNDLRLRRLCAGSVPLTARCVSARRYIDTLLNIKAWLGPDDEYYTIIGTDSAVTFKTWHLYEEILEQSKLVVVLGRDGYAGEFDFPYIPLRIDSNFERISATAIREKYKSEDPEEYLADVRSGRFMTSYAKDRLCGFVFFAEGNPKLYVGNGISYPIIPVGVSIDDFKKIDGRRIIAEGKIDNQTFVLEKIAKRIDEEN